MPNLGKLPTWADKTHIHAVVERPRGSRCKLEFDPKLRAFTLVKPLMAGLTYPYDRGFIPSTHAEDGDPLDVLINHDAGDLSRLSSLLQTDRRARNSSDH
jgi:inorganic pyrophosphatase